MACVKLSVKVIVATLTFMNTRQEKGKQRTSEEVKVRRI